MKESIFSKGAGYRPTTSLKMNFLVGYRNKGINKKKNTKKIFPPQGKEVFNSYIIGKLWFDHEEESWNFESCSKIESCRKIVIQEVDMN